MRLKRGYCPGCKDRQAFLEEEYEYNEETDDWGTRKWCQVCGHRWFPKKKQPRVDRMTPTQERKIAWLHRAIFEHDSLGQPEKHEYKRWDVELRPDARGMVLLVSEVGMIGDEGTLAAVFARTRRIIAIYRGGRMALLNSRDKKKITGHKVSWWTTD